MRLTNIIILLLCILIVRSQTIFEKLEQELIATQPDFTKPFERGYIPEFVMKTPPATEKNEKKTTEELVRGFSIDGYNVVRLIDYKGQRGIIADHKTVKVLSTGLPKRVFYVEGNAYEMGYLQGLLAKPELERMVTVYLRAIPFQMFSREFLEKYQNTTVFKIIEDVLEAILTKTLLVDYEELEKKGYIPKELTEEMQGIVDACRAQGPTNVTLQRIISLNYGMDYFLGILYTGDIKSLIYDIVKNLFKAGKVSMKDMMEIVKILKESLHKYIRPPFACNGAGLRRTALADPSDVIFIRDFQLATGYTYQHINTMTIYNPTDGRIPMINAHVPGFVGATTAMNKYGVSIGVNILTSSATTGKVIGLNSMLLLRYVAHHAKTTREAIELIENAGRGVSWLYQICDATGDCVVIEAGKYEETPTDPLTYVSFLVRPFVPKKEFIEKYSPIPSRKGMYVRDIDYVFPKEFFQFNKRLIEFTGTPYNDSVWGERDIWFNTAAEENIASKKLMTFYFNPQRENREDVILLSNGAIIPQMRLSQMGTIPAIFDAFTPGTLQWRYDLLNRHILDNWGKIDEAKALDIAMYLAPDRVDYWVEDRVDPNDPMTAAVLGSIHVCRLRDLIMHTLSGHYCTPWIKLSLKNYIVV